MPIILFRIILFPIWNRLEGHCMVMHFNSDFFIRDLMTPAFKWKIVYNSLQHLGKQVVFAYFEIIWEPFKFMMYQINLFL